MTRGWVRGRTSAGRQVVAVAALIAMSYSLAAESTEPVPPSRRVRELLAADRWQDALALARAESAQRPADADLAGALAEALFRGGRIDEARRVVEPLLDRPSPPPRALLAAALVRSASGRETEAAILFERAVAADPNDPELLFRAADGAMEGQRAVELLQQYLARSAGDDPDRIEAAKGSLAFHRALGARKVWIPDGRPERVEIPLRPIGGRGRTDGLIVDARLGDGKPVRLLLDTGSTGLFVVERVAKRFGFSTLAEETTFGGGGDERHRSRRGVIPSFALGGLKFRDALVTVSKAEIDPTGRYQGVVGLQPFGGYRVTLDLEAGTIVLDEPQTPVPGGTPYWTVAGQLLVLAGSDGGAAGLFLFDSGASVSVISRAFAASVGLVDDSGDAVVRGYGGDVRGARTVRGVNLAFLDARFRGESIPAVDLSLRSRMGGVEVSGFLGMDLLGGRRWIIDPVNRTVGADPQATPAPRRRR